MLTYIIRAKEEGLFSNKCNFFSLSEYFFMLILRNRKVDCKIVNLIARKILKYENKKIKN